MPVLNRKKRKILITLAILTAIFLFVSGQTFLKSYLEGKRYIVYWNVCLFFTTLALYLAIVELRFIKMESNKEFRDLLETTLSGIRKNYDDKTKTEKKQDEAKNEK